jgi:hypothetical protein
MVRYSLEVMAPLVRGVPGENALRLVFALESLAVIHGGAVVEPPDADSQPSYRRQYVNISDCESTLEKEVEWLRREFPDTTFTLKKLMQNEPRTKPSQGSSLSSSET